MEEIQIKEAEQNVTKLRECCGALQEQMATVVIGQDEVVRLLITGLMSGGHVLLVGVPGLAKTLLVSTLAKSLSMNFKRIQFTPDLMPADITGTEIIGKRRAGQSGSKFFMHAIFANMVLADESTARRQKRRPRCSRRCRNSVTAGGEPTCSRPFFVLATQNPIEQEGTYPLPEAQLDRFMLSIHVDYPSRLDEIEIAGRPLRSKGKVLTPVTKKEDFRGFIEIIDQMPVSKHVLEHAVALTGASRPKDASADDYVRRYVAWGARPRATQHLVTAAKASALLEGRPSPEVGDLHRLAGPVLRHRIIPNYNALGEGISSDSIVRHLLESVREPVSA